MIKFCVVTSPPYANEDVAYMGKKGEAHKRMGTVGHRNQDDGYGRTPGQLGAMKEGTLEMTEVQIPKETWRGLYDNGWQEGEITAESFSHPAKMAKGLVYKIVKEGILRGWWSRKDIICDPFGGIGSTGLACSAFGMQSVLVELEQKFCDLANANFRLHARAWDALSLPHPIILQGDSRQLASIVRASGCVTSPPWVGQAIIDRPGFTPYTGLGHYEYSEDVANQRKENYGSTPGQIGAMKEGPFGVVTSPPFGDVVGKQDKNFSPPHATTTAFDSDYGQTPGQIGNLGAITSPPYANRVDDSGTGPVAEKNGKYGESAGQMGNLRIAGAVTSPPWENQEPSHAQNDTPSRRRLQEATGMKGSFLDSEYGTTEGQLGETTGETYWQAVEQVYRQVYELFGHDGHMACVVKSFVRKKQIVPLPEMTLALLERIGFEPVLWVDAMLVGETQQSMLEEVPPSHGKERKSFFRRLAEKKGSPRIDSEVCLVVRKP